jgi:hypothetical protein
MLMGLAAGGTAHAQLPEEQAAEPATEEPPEHGTSSPEAGEGTETSDAAFQQLRVAPYFLLGFGGVSQGVELAATVGLGGRVEYPVWDYIEVGADLSWAALKFEFPGADRSHVLDFDPFVKGRYVFEVAGMPMEIYALVPIGYSHFFADQGSNEPGWNIGFLAGAELLLTDWIGVFAELGFKHHEFYPDGTNDIKTTQGRMHLGAVFALGI